MTASTTTPTRRVGIRRRAKHGRTPRLWSHRRTGLTHASVAPSAPRGTSSPTTWCFRRAVITICVPCVSIVPCEAYVALVRVVFAQDTVRKGRPQRQRPVAEIAVGEHHQGEPRDRICPDQRA